MSKELEALGKIKEEIEIISNSPSYPDYYEWDMLEKNEAIVEKALKALEIIKAKDVYIYTIKNMDLSCYGYNNLMINDNKRLTQEEFDLLKEVLS